MKEYKAYEIWKLKVPVIIKAENVEEASKKLAEGQHSGADYSEPIEETYVGTDFKSLKEVKEV